MSIGPDGNYERSPLEPHPFKKEHWGLALAFAAAAIFGISVDHHWADLVSVFASLFAGSFAFARANNGRDKNFADWGLIVGSVAFGALTAWSGFSGIASEAALSNDLG